MDHTSISSHGEGHRGTTEAAAQDPLLRAAARLAALPTFPAAVQQYTVGQARFREAPRLINKLLSSDVRWRLIGYLLYLHCDRELYGPEGGATYGRLLDLSTRRQEATPRTVKTMLALLQLTGFVQAKRNVADKRSKYYRPTERIYGFVRQWLGYGTAALDVLEPEKQRTRLLQEDPGFIDRFLVSGGRDHLTGTPPIELMPEFKAFFDAREGTFPVLVAVLMASFQGRAAPSRAEIAKKYGFSKTQVTNVVLAAEAEGYLDLDAAGAPTPTDKLRVCYDQWISIELAFYAQHMQPPGAALSAGELPGHAPLDPA